MTTFAIIVGLLLILQGVLGIGGARRIGRIPFIAVGVMALVTPFVAKQIGDWIFFGVVITVIAISFGVQYGVEHWRKRKGSKEKP